MKVFRKTSHFGDLGVACPIQWAAFRFDSGAEEPRFQAKLEDPIHCETITIPRLPKIQRDRDESLRNSCLDLVN